MPKVRIADVDLYYEERGQGPPLVLIAGIASDCNSWLPVVTEFARSHRVITFDNRGAGRTTPMEAPTGIGAMADDCIALMGHLGLPAAYVVGHSMGGFIGQEVALRAPERVAALVLAGTALRTSRRDVDLFATWTAALERGIEPAFWFRNLFYWLFSAKFFERPKDVDDLIRFAVEYPYPQSTSAFRRQVDAIAAFDSSAAAARIAAPTLVLAGGQDLIFPVAECKALADAIPGARFDVIAEAAHSIHVEFGAEFNRRVVDFLGGVRLAGASGSAP